jgi:hypothetical protein
LKKNKKSVFYRRRQESNPNTDETAVDGSALAFEVRQAAFSTFARV